MADIHGRDHARREFQVHQYKSEADKGLTALQEAERKVQNYRIEVKQFEQNYFWGEGGGWVNVFNFIDIFLHFYVLHEKIR